MSLPRLFKSFQPFTGSYVHELVNQWFETELGQSTLQAESSLLDQILPSMFGYYLMQTGMGAPQLLTSASPIKHRFYVCEETYPKAPMACVQSRFSDLSVASDSIDVALLHHSLDFDNNPHRLLREISRTLIPGGKMVIVGFNPWSLWGIFRLLRATSPKAPWCGNFLSPYRVSDWLNLLDFEVEGCECVIFGPPNSGQGWGKHFRWLSYFGKRWWSQRGAVYVLVATKRVARLTPIKNISKPTLVPPIPINGIARPAPRSSKVQSRTIEE
ncbi:MAG: class I SAM-dependent methyltransferase [Pseudomonadales bacterium]|nr:class I SAM-dependent methyltransferase [Pseudomonadales bacterium]